MGLTSHWGCASGGDSPNSGAGGPLGGPPPPPGWSPPGSSSLPPSGPLWSDGGKLGLLG